VEKEQPRAVAALVRHLFQSARMLDTRKKEDSLDWAQAFIDQPPAVIGHALEENGISFTPDRLIPGPEELHIIQDYMTGTMGVMSGPVEINTFLNPAYATQALSETTP
jgi:hypothetical protein